MIAKELRYFIAYCKNQASSWLILIGIVGIVGLADAVFNLTLYSRAFGYVESLYEQWGLLFIFIASIAEGVLLLNWYFPGNIIILTGALLSRSGVVPFWEFSIVVFSGFYLAFLFDYLIGRYGLYRVLIRFSFVNKRIESAKRALEKRAVPTFFIWYIHSQSGNFVATAAGVLKFPFLKFLFLNLWALSFWIGLWLGLVYILGDAVIGIMDNYFYFAVFFLLIIWLLIGYAKHRRHNNLNVSTI